MHWSGPSRSQVARRSCHGRDGRGQVGVGISSHMTRVETLKHTVRHARRGFGLGEVTA